MIKYMNKKQKIVIVVMIPLILFTFFFPPFFSQYQTGINWNYGYHFIFNPPNVQCTVNIGMLFAEWVGILLVGSLFWLLFKEKY
jgi:hypothetical protein